MAQPITSNQFCSDDADITFLSSDNVVFKIHRKNLDTSCGLFPPTEFKNEPDELVPLSEDSETLEQLFVFIYPKRHPDLIDVPTELLKKVAEAAEKYEVFAAMNICKTRMRERISVHPLDTFVYGYKHGYDELAENSAPLLHNIPLASMVKKLPASLIVPWVEYHEQWRRKVMETFLSASPLDDDDKPRSPYTSHHHNLNDRTLVSVMRQVFCSTNRLSREIIQTAVRQAPSSRTVNGGWPHAGRANDRSDSEAEVQQFMQVFDERTRNLRSFNNYLQSK